jgi:hypothetical protein
MSGSGAGFTPPIPEDCDDNCDCIACLQRRTIDALIEDNRQVRATLGWKDGIIRKLTRQRDEANERILDLEGALSLARLALKAQEGGEE